MRDPGDEKMEQIRELLVGESLRHSEARLAAIEARIAALEADLARRFDAMTARFEALVGTTDAERRTHLDELAKGMLDLAERIKTMSRR